MKSVRLVHWKPSEAAPLVAKLRSAGYRVDYEELNPRVIRSIREVPPDAFVIDLSRAPSQGRDIGIAFRTHKSTRHVPLVFVEGEPEKIARVRKALPDAVHTSWSRIRSSLKKAIAHPPADPVVPESSMAGYSGTPLVKKLGIKPDSVVALVGASKGFEKTLGRLPQGAQLRWGARGRPDLVIWFVKSRKDLERRVERLGELAGGGGLWVAWPKQASGVATDLTQAAVRKAGLASGLVDYKICAIDDTWSGLRFARRKSK